MSIKIATKSLVIEAAGARTEVVEGSLYSSDHPAVQARPKSFANATQKQIADSTAKAPGE